MFAIPDQKLQKNHFEIKINNLASFINTHDWHGKMIGLNSVDQSMLPNVALVFYSFRVMVGIGFLMLFLALYGVYVSKFSSPEKHKYYLYALLFASPVGFIAIESGWFTAEAGRQPWVVYNHLLTANAASDITANHVLIAFILIVIVYGIIFGYFYFKYLLKIIKDGPCTKPDTNLPFGYLQQHNTKEVN